MGCFGHAGGNGIYRYHEGEWRNFNVRDGLPSGNVTSIAVDDENRIWCGTPGKGAFVFSSTGGSAIEILGVFDQTNKLTGSDTPSFVIVDDIGVDANGVIWLLNRFANNGRAVVAVDASAGLDNAVWTCFPLTKDWRPIRFRRYPSTIRETYGSALPPAPDSPMLNYNTTLSDKSDDTWTTYRTTNGLASNVINFLTKDQNGYIWIATPMGANYWDGTAIRSLTGLIDSNVETVAVDPLNNKWFGTHGGLTMVDCDNYRFAHFTSLSSPLVDDEILSIVNGETGAGVPWNRKRRNVR